MLRFSKLMILWSLSCGLAAGQQPEHQLEDDRTLEVRNAIQSYVAAYNAQDSQQLAAHWSPEGVYISRTSDEQVVGRDALAAEFSTMFQGGDDPKLAVATESIEFVSPSVAVERGLATVTRANEVVESTYTVVYVKHDGDWLIDRVTEEEQVLEISHDAHLVQLEWLVGDWLDEGDGVRVEISCDWTKQRNFLSRTCTVSNDAEVELSGLQIIGWDAKQQHIRSWLFDSNGGFIEGTWSQRDDRWIVQSVATLANGERGSFTSIFRPQDENSYTWQKINRVVNGQLLPNVDETIIRRQ